MYAGKITPRYVAVRVLNLPSGSAMWQRYGGAMAFSEEIHAARFLEHAAAMTTWAKAGKKGKAPKPLPFPALYTDQTEQQDKLAGQAERWLARHNERMAAREQQAAATGKG